MKIEAKNSHLQLHADLSIWDLGQILSESEIKILRIP